jgi:flavin-dependent dehydrogenase
MRHLDVAIIGGSLAGAGCVRELTRLGIEAVAFERDRFPREKVCGGFLSPGAITLLDQLGILGTVRAAGAKTVSSTRIRMGGFEATVALPQSGLGISRRTLDALVADHPGVQHATVRDVLRVGERFRVQLGEGEVSATVVVDAAGKLSRFTRRRTVPQFGVQFYETESRDGVLDFWFFEEGYGGAVSVEDGRSNVCFLLNRNTLPRMMKSGPDMKVTGPLSYERRISDYIPIGDAAGMVDPFCGEGMRHALDTGICAATMIAEGLQKGQDYDAIKARCENESQKRWRRKRVLGKVFRSMLQYPRLSSVGFRLKPEYWLRKLWD